MNESTISSIGEPIRVEELAAPQGYGHVGGPGISADGLTIYYSTGLTDLDDESDDYKSAMRTFVSTRPSRDLPFGPPVELTTLATPGLSAPEVSADGLSLYMRLLTVGRRDSDVYLAQRASSNDPWGTAEPLTGFAKNDRWEAHPAISADGRTLFLEYGSQTTNLWNTRNVGGADLSVAIRSSKDQPWSQPFDLGDLINLNQYERYDSSPFITADGSTLYFSSAQAPLVDITTWDIYQAPVLAFTAEPLAGGGSSYTQNFDNMGPDASQAGLQMPSGWTFTPNDVAFGGLTTRSFPATTKRYVGAYNAGADGAADRTLVTDVTTNESGELDFRTLVRDADVQALRLGFDIEAWQLRSGLGANPGEAAFHVVLEADSGNGFQQVADLGEFSTGKTLVRPATGSQVDGNDPAYRRSFDSGPVDLDVPVGATLRTRWMGTKGSINVVFGLDNVSLRFAAPEDANIDGLFNSTDLVQVFQAGEYEDSVAGNSKWADGDWTNDNEFDSSDLVKAFQTGKYEQAGAATSSVPEPTSWVLTLFGAMALAGRRRTLG